MPKFVDVVKNASSTTNITGEELFPIIQNGLTKKISIAELQEGPFAAAISPNILHSVIGIPAASVGNDGDYAIDTYYKNFYGPKTNGVWPLGFSMVGEAGPAGFGVVAGGITGEVLIKNSNDNYDTTWAAQAGKVDFLLQNMGVI